MIPIRKCVLRTTTRLLVAMATISIGNCGVYAEKTCNVGIAATDITPPMQYPMSGYFHPRYASDVLDPLHAKAIVFEQNGRYAAIVVCDLLGIAHDLSTHVRQRVEKLTGIPADHIILAATHTHTGPDYHPELYRTTPAEIDDFQNKNYVPMLVRRIVEAVETAQDDCHAMGVQAGSGENDEVSFNRRFVMQDGTVRTWASYRDPDVVRAAGPIDSSLPMLVFRQAETNELVGGFATFALHLDTSDGDKKTFLGADYPAPMQRVLHEQLGSRFLLIFGTGTCGDINHADPRVSERNTQVEIGASLADTFLQAMSDLEAISPRLAVRTRKIRLPLQSVTADQLRQSHDLLRRIDAGENVPMLEHVEAHRVTRLAAIHGLQLEGAEAGVDTPIRKVSRSLVGIGDHLPIEIQAIQLSTDTVIVGLPGEVFVDLGLLIKRYSPYARTFVVELANMDDIAYVPTKLAASGGGYEVVNSVLAPGAGEQMVEASVQLLRELKTAGGK